MARPIERFVLQSVVSGCSLLYYTVRGWEADTTTNVCCAVLFPNDTLSLPKNMSSWKKVPARMSEHRIILL